MRERSKDWIGVDFDRTLATYDRFIGAGHCGEPIPEMVERIEGWLREGKNVRIFTARVYAPPDDAQAQQEAAEAMLAIQDWCSLYVGEILPVTCMKDYDMVEFWDDRAVQVIPNTGKRADGK